MMVRLILLIALASLAACDDENSSPFPLKTPDTGTQPEARWDEVSWGQFEWQ